MQKLMTFGYIGLPDPYERVGLRDTRYLGNGRAFQVMTCRGSLTLRCESFIVREITVPLAALLIGFAIYPTVAFIRGPLRRRRRRKRGECEECGYNLTGNVSGICPECGVEIRLP